MPIYEYQCNECGKGFEKVVPFSESSHSQTCPTCQSQDTRKKISRFASFGDTLRSGSLSSSSSCSPRGGFS
jgi:putative FmdB family regulatory protein